MKTIKAKALEVKTFVVIYKKELAMIIGGTAVAVTGLILLNSMEKKANENMSPEEREAWIRILNPELVD